jgi:1-acyl-sn-glycerol-3-phosphate acyltransferase
MSEEPIFVKGHMSPAGVERMRKAFSALLHLLARIEVRGLENVPAGGVIMSPNHLSWFDPPLIFIQFPHRKVTVFNADTYRTNRVFSYVMTGVDLIWVARGATSPSTIKYGIRALKGGSMLGIAPEGTRSKTHALQEGKTGAVYLAYAAGVPLVPIALTNTDKLASSLKKLKRTTLTVTFGKPMYFGAPGQRRPDAEQLELDTTEVMCRIAAMLPPEYRGVYANHPRLQELLQTAPEGAKALAAP